LEARVRLRLCVFALLIGWWSPIAVVSTYAKAGVETETAELLIALLKAGRTIVSERQDLINDPRKGHKGFTDEQMGRELLERFKAQTHIDLSQPNNLPQRDLLLAMVQAEREVILDMQPVINKQGIGYKGFGPSLFVRKAGQKYFAKTGITAKLTGMEYRFPGNQPDDFEAEVLRMFADPRHPKGQQYGKATIVNGKPVMRVMNPDYAEASCLTCHGSPKGEWDMTGMQKEGWKEGALAGAISVVIPLR
jgi:general secretion pathway protein A